ncbi:MAG TPA: DNA/RNA non-specific endonuclease [Pyrinomonadaceae bacterium]
MSGLPPRGSRTAPVRHKLFALLIISLLITVALFPGRFARSTNVQAVSTSIVISQFQVAGDGSPAADDEFVELHNVSGASVDLSGYRVVYRSAAGTNDVQVTTWSASTIIPAGGYYLIGHTPAYNGAVAADRAFDASVAFSGTGGGMAIRNGALNSGAIVDAVGFGTATNAFVETTATAAPAANNSASRKTNGCQDTDNNASDFETLTPAAPRNSSTAPNICSGGPAPTGTPKLVKVSDYDADNHTDYVVWQPSSGMWSIAASGDSSVRSRQWGEGSLNDRPVPGDYDGDGEADIAVFRPSEGNWYILNSSTNLNVVTGWGASTDEPVQADYDGDGKADIAVFRPSEGNWYIRQSSGGSQVIGWGNSTDKLVPGDYDGDGKADAAVFRPSEGNWYIHKSVGGAQIINFGISTDQPVAGDYDGDGKLDVAVFRGNEGNWYIRQSSNSATIIRNWGESTDKLVPGDYDGDKKTDIAIWRPSEAKFYIINSSGSPAVTIQQHGTAGDIPIASTYKTFGSSDGLTTPPPPPPPLTDNHLAMGNPSNAVADVNFPTNYLMDKPQYALSYHRDKGEPNWVSWHLDSSWLGSAPRQNDYRADPAVPAGWYQVQGTDYSGSGYDRGHMCPSGDRTRSVPDNSATFLMTNFIPQASANNQGPWNDLEIYCRSLVSQGNELYIIDGGAGSLGTITNGHVNIPAQTWKVIIVLPAASGDDAARVTTSTRTIAVIMPNTSAVNPDWRASRVSVDQVEALTGYDFFSNVNVSTQAVIESVVDNQ